MTEAEDLDTPLTQKIEKFSTMLLYMILGLAVVTFFAGTIHDWPYGKSFVAAVALAVAAILFVNINGTELYGWQAGLAHGLFFLPNLVRHLFDGDVLFKATNCTTGYHVAWWIVTVGSCIGWLVDATFSFMKASVFVGSDKE